MMLREYGTYEDAVNAAKYLRPGIKVTAGAVAGRDVLMPLLTYAEWRRLPGPSSFLARDLGFEPSLWAVSFGRQLSKITGQPLTETVPIFCDSRLSLSEARKIIADAEVDA